MPHPISASLRIRSGCPTRMRAASSRARLGNPASEARVVQDRDRCAGIDRRQVSRRKVPAESISPCAIVPAQTPDLAPSVLRIAAAVAPTWRISVKPSVRTCSSATERGAMQVAGSVARRIALVSAGGSAASAYLASSGPATKEPANPIMAACVKKRDRRCRIGAATHHFQKAAQHNFPCASGLGDDSAVAGALAGARLPSAVLVQWKSPEAALRATIWVTRGAARFKVE
jgi:hypothetical protein